ncbi:hypothetical protein DSO57_1036124 [Entomophthora muscae]|uniref:Uncharacterized protein n=1 Tax=Entomophthora muscae TaxID=34485 RepID=A0ACC2RQC0_9FUNG|nr:hypothetical protein DSO57_1036124 [Entomophthora muscae]
MGLFGQIKKSSNKSEKNKRMKDEASSYNIDTVRNDNLDAPESQSWETNNPLLIDKVVASLPGSKPLTVTQDSTSKLPVQDAGNFPKVPIPDTSSFLSEIHKSSNESYSELPQSPGSGTEPEEAPNAQVAKQKDSKSSQPKAASANPPVPSATLPSKTPFAKPPKLRKPSQEIKPGSAV